MGILDRILGRSKERAEDANHREQPSENKTNTGSETNALEEGLTKLTGTTTFCREAILALASRHGITADGYLELPGSLQREPDNVADPTAVAVMVEGDRIGYLPSYYSTSATQLTALGSQPLRVQIFTEMLPKGLRAEAWGWLGNTPPQWAWNEAERPPMSSSAKAQAEHLGSRQMVQDALANGGQRAEEFRAGMVNGVHYLELVEPIKELKREGRLEDALTLCYAAIDGAENSREGREPAPFYTEQAAIILRKLGRREDEIAVLNRWLTLCPPEHRVGSRIGERLSKLT